MLLEWLFQLLCLCNNLPQNLVVKITIYYAAGFCGSGGLVSASAGRLEEWAGVTWWLVHSIGWWLILGKSKHLGAGQLGLLGHLSVYPCCFPTWSLQHCNFKFAGLFTKWFRAPKVHNQEMRGVGGESASGGNCILHIRLVQKSLRFWTVNYKSL